jgi:hypothetical protein
MSGSVVSTEQFEGPGTCSLPGSAELPTPFIPSMPGVSRKINAFSQSSNNFSSVEGI